MTVFDEADALLRDALVVTAHARPRPGDDEIEPGESFVAAFAVENQGVGDHPGTHARCVFKGVVLRVEATPFAAPVVDGEIVNDITIEVGELIYGEASGHELTMRATTALDGPEPFARVHVHGQLDLDRFFASTAVHQFTTDIRRRPTHDAAASEFGARMKAEVLPEGFRLSSWSFDLDEDETFRDLVDDQDRFRAFVRERVAELAEERGVAAAAVGATTRVLDELYVDVLESGYTGSLAFALWFMDFDHGESFAFDAVRDVARDYLVYDTFETRRELRVFKGFVNDGILVEPVTVVDLPVVVDYGARTVTLWAGSLRG